MKPPRLARWLSRGPLTRRWTGVWGLALAGCSASPPPRPAPASRAPAAPVPTLVAADDELILLDGKEGLRASGWITGERVVAISNAHLWILDARRPDSALVRPVDAGSVLTTDPRTDVFTVRSGRTKTLDVYRGAELWRTLDDPDRAPEVVAVAPSGKYLVLRHGDDQRRVYDLERSHDGAVLPGDLLELSPSSRLALTRAGVFDLEGHSLHRFPKLRATIRSLADSQQTAGWIDETAFVFDQAGVDSYDAASQRPRRIPLPCLAADRADRVDAPNRRLLRACGNRIYVVAWPSGDLERVRLPESLKADPPYWELYSEASEPAFRALAVARSGAARSFEIVAGRSTAATAEDDEWAGCATQFHGPKLNRASYCGGALQPNGPLLLSQVGSGVGIADLQGDRELAVFGLPPRSTRGDEPYVRVDHGLEVAVAGAARYRFPSTELPSAPPPRTVGCGDAPLVPEWTRPAAALYRRVDASQCLCTSASCTNVTAARVVLDARVGSMLTAESFVDDKTQLQLDGRPFELPGACPYAALGDTSALLLCRLKDEPYRAIEVGLRDVVVLRDHELPKAVFPKSLEAFRGGALVDSAMVPAVLWFGECKGAECNDSHDYFGEDFGVLHGPNGLEVAGDAERAARALWCLTPTSGDFSIARPFDACRASSGVAR